MNTPQLNDLQARAAAVDTLKSFAVSAPAGSGKTGLLSLRFLKLLSQVQKPEEILAITFTRKAAREMHERIVEALQQARHYAGRSELDGSALEPYQQALLDAASAALKRSDECGWDLLNNSLRLNISTIDGLCKQLCNALPFFSGLGANSGIVDQPGTEYRIAVERWLQRQLKQRDHKELSQLLVHFGGKLERLTELLCRLLSVREQWLPLLVHARQNHSELQSHFQRVLVAWVEQAQQQVAQLLAPYETELIDLLAYAAANSDEAKDPEPLRRLAQVSAFPISAEHSQWWRDLANFCLSKGATPAFRKRLDKNLGFPAGNSKAEKDQAKAKKQALLQVFAEIDSMPGLLAQMHQLRRLPDGYYSEQQWPVLLALLQVLPELAAELKLRFSELGQSDFSEIALGAVSALNSDIGDMDLLQRLDYRLQHLLIDEFQDTSQLQLELLQALTQAWQPDDGRTLFLVGDGMQSCYGFRNANVGIFLTMRTKGLDNIALHSLDLTANFRSDPLIVNWVNNCFGPSFPLKNDINLGAVSYIPSQTSKSACSDACVELRAFDADSEHTGAEANFICAQIKQLQLSAPEQSIAVLAKSRAHLSELITALQAANIAYQAIDIDRLSSKRHVQDALILCRLLFDPADTLAWLALLRSPFCALNHRDLSACLSERPQQLTHTERLREVLSQQKLSDGGAERLAKLLEQLEPVLAARHLRRAQHNLERLWYLLGGPLLLNSEAERDDLQTLFALVGEHEVAGQIKDWPRFESALDELYAAAANTPGPSVQLMTMHKSKGLEFDTVFLPGLARASRAQDSEALYWLERLNEAGYSDFILSPIARYDADDDDSLSAFIKAQHKLKQSYENHRVFYVACTRARKRLYLTGEFKLDEQGKLQAPPAGSLLGPAWQQLQSQFELGPSLTSSRSEALASQHPDSPSISLLENAGPACESDGTSKITALSGNWRTAFEQHFARPAAQAFDNSDFDLMSSWRELDSIESRAGTVLHRVLAHFSENPDQAQSHYLAVSKGSDAAWQSLFRQQGVDVEHSRGFIEHFRHCLAQRQHEDVFQWLMQARTFSRSEWPLSYLSSRADMRSVVIDRCFIDADTLWLIDYKSSKPTDGQSLQQFIDEEKRRYAEQLAGYKHALSIYFAQRSSVLFTQTRCALYFPLLGQLAELENLAQASLDLD
ncbi:UvrD-helicase domain-containing protein [Agaribacterium haliotis]|uniref:UvrD-helicase domain-containing protein n=1 Tax=Agaribacterium haliotis TaxID=2013869 RepID=UPI000BB55C25|nr:UvrD-helicase domain-containing protein [Agaribacterium haliotis]